MKLTYSCIALCAFVGCKHAVVGQEGGRDQIRRHFESTLGKVTAVTCPKDVPVEAGGKYACSIQFTGGETFDVKVTQKDDRGNVEFELAERPVPTTKLVPAIAAWLKEQSGKSATVDCGSGVRRFRDGRYACTATFGGGDRQTIVVTMDETGSYSWNVGGARTPQRPAPAPVGGEADASGVYNPSGEPQVRVTKPAPAAPVDD